MPSFPSYKWVASLLVSLGLLFLLTHDSLHKFSVHDPDVGPFNFISALGSRVGGEMYPFFYALGGEAVPAEGDLISVDTPKFRIAKAGSALNIPQGFVGWLLEALACLAHDLVHWRDFTYEWSGRLAAIEGKTWVLAEGVSQKLSDAFDDFFHIVQADKSQGMFDESIALGKFPPKSSYLVKRPHPDAGHEALSALNVEASVLSELDHENIVKPVAVFARDGSVTHLVFEKPLMHLSEQSWFFSSAIDVFEVKSIVWAIYYLHSKGISHGAISRENVAMFDNGQLKLIGFTCSSKHFYVAPGACTVMPALSVPAPEMKGNFRVRALPVDVWDLGIFLHETVPQGDKDLDDLLLKMLDHNPRSRLTLTQVVAHPWMADYFEDAL